MWGKYFVSVHWRGVYCLDWHPDTKTSIPLDKTCGRSSIRNSTASGISQFPQVRPANVTATMRVTWAELGLAPASAWRITDLVSGASLGKRITQEVRGTWSMSFTAVELSSRASPLLLVCPLACWIITTLLVASGPRPCRWHRLCPCQARRRCCLSRLSLGADGRGLEQQVRSARAGGFVCGIFGCKECPFWHGGQQGVCRKSHLDDWLRCQCVALLLVQWLWMDGISKPLNALLQLFFPTGR